MVDRLMRMGFEELKRQAPNDPTPTMNSPSCPGQAISFGWFPAIHGFNSSDECILCNLEWHSRYRDVR